MRHRGKRVFYNDSATAVNYGKGTFILIVGNREEAKCVHRQSSLGPAPGGAMALRSHWIRDGMILGKLIFKPAVKD